jgi:hypothetical protein
MLPEANVSVISRRACSAHVNIIYLLLLTVLREELSIYFNTDSLCLKYCCLHIVLFSFLVVDCT